MGSRGAGTKAFLTDVGNRVKPATGNQRAMEFLRQRVSVEIQRRNAASVMRKVENTKDWSSLFLLSYRVFRYFVSRGIFDHSSFVALIMPRAVVYRRFLIICFR